MKALRAVVGLLGELAVSLGVLLFAFVGWQLWWTDLEAGRTQAQAVTRLEQDFESPVVQPGVSAGRSSAATTVQPTPALGDAFALIRVPRFGSEFVRPVMEGTTADILADGVGHYVGTALPGEAGNFATAGHRTTYAKPYSDIDALRAGDLIVIETQSAYHVYAVTSHTVVLPSATEVIQPVPGHPGATPSRAVMTLTSCNPRYSAAERYVVHAALSATHTRAAGLPPRVLDAPKGA